MTVRDELVNALALAAKATAGPWSANNRGCYQIGGEDEGSVTSADGWNDIDEVSCVTPLSAQDTIRGDTTYRDAAFIASVANLIRDHGPALVEALDRPGPSGVVISVELAKFLYGSGPLNGVWYGDDQPVGHSRFWWRGELAQALTDWNQRAGG